MTTAIKFHRRLYSFLFSILCLMLAACHDDTDKASTASERYELSGMVFNGPLAGATVRVFGASSGELLGESVTDEDGRYSFELAVDGPYRVETSGGLLDNVPYEGSLTAECPSVPCHITPFTTAIMALSASREISYSAASELLAELLEFEDDPFVRVLEGSPLPESVWDMDAARENIDHGSALTEWVNNVVEWVDEVKTLIDSGLEEDIDDLNSPAGVPVVRYTVSATAGEGGSISPPTANAVRGDTAAFTVTPDVGYQLVSVEGCNGTLVDGIYTTDVITASCEILASFEQLAYSVTAEAGSGGSISPLDADVAYGNIATLTLTPDEGYTIAGVTGCDGTLDGTTFTTGAITGTCSISATFSRLSYEVTTTVENGTITSTLNPTSFWGDSVTVTGNASANFYLASVSGCGATAQENTDQSITTFSYTTGAITSDCEVSAIFEERTGSSLGGSISGLGERSGLVLANGSDSLSIVAGASSFTFTNPVSAGDSYSVSVQDQPAGMACEVTNGAGVMALEAITSVVVTCTPLVYTVSGTISGLSDAGLVLVNNGADDNEIEGNATTFTMSTGVASGNAYAITAKREPIGITCSITDGSGTVVASNVTNVAIECAPTTTISVVHEFDGINGSTPGAALLQAADGNFYGATTEGGINISASPIWSGISDSASTKIYRMTPEGAVVIRATLQGVSASPLMQAQNGEFYGTTANAGTYGHGAIYRMNADGEVTVLHSFNIDSVVPTDFGDFYVGGDGKLPIAAMLETDDGAYLYGTTILGGVNAMGTIYRIKPDGTDFEVMHHFDLNTEGWLNIGGLLKANDGNYYGNLGASFFGGTSVFKMTPTGEFSILSAFIGGNDWGGSTYGGLVQGGDSALYGALNTGGLNDKGCVYKVTLDGTATLLHSFNGTDGNGPAAKLIQASDGGLYGLTNSGGEFGKGTLFRINLDGSSFTVLHSFTDLEGGNTVAELMEADDGKIYGVTPSGGTNGKGTVFKW